MLWERPSSASFPHMLPRAGATVKLTRKQEGARFIGDRARRGLYLDCRPGTSIIGRERLPNGAGMDPMASETLDEATVEQQAEGAEAQVVRQEAAERPGTHGQAPVVPMNQQLGQ